MNEERAAFGPRLRREREARGLTLTAIAETTKIKGSLFAALERSDVSQWPAGIYRRAFIKDYATAIGLPTEPLVAEFVRLFPEAGAIPDSAHDRGPQPAAQPLRLTLADDRASLLNQAGRHLVAASLDAGAVLVVSAVFAFMLQTNFWSASGIVGLGYFTIGTMFLGRSAGSRWLSGQKVFRLRVPKQPQEPAELLSRELVDLITTRPASGALRPH